MKKQQRLIMWFVGLFMMLFSVGAMAENPTYLCKIQNATQVSCNMYEFDVVMQRTGTTTLRLANFQFGITVNPSMIPAGAFCNASMVPGSANALNAQMRPTDAKFSFNNDKNIIIVTPVAPQGWANSTIISNLATGTKLCRIRVACSAPWVVSQTTTHAWSFDLALGYATKIFAYTGTVSPGVNTDVTGTGTFSVAASPNGNLTLNNTGTPPTAQNVTSDITEVCLQPGAGAIISLDNSQNGYTYYMYRNDTLLGTAGTVAFGIAGPVSFGALQTGGVISVKSVGCSGMVNMSNTVTLTSLTPLLASVTINATNPVAPSTPVTVHCMPVNGGAAGPLMYQWYVNGVPDYNTFDSTYTFTPVHGDYISCEMFSSETCVTPAAAPSNVITFMVGSFFNVSGTATICQGATTPVGLSGSTLGMKYDLYKDAVIVTGQQLTGTGNPLSWTVGVSGTYTVKDTNGIMMTGSAVITVNPNVTPTFTQLGPYCVGATPDVLPLTSNNGVTGTWDGPITTATAGSTIYHFTPDAGQCAVATTMTVVVTAPVDPTFAAYGPYCVGATPAALPTTSLNGIPGTWNPASISTAQAGSTDYTFTPDAGQCANPKTITVVVNAPVTPTFAQLGPYCQGAATPSLPSVSQNGIPGTWSPSSISTATAGSADYTFTPNAGQCATTYVMTIVVNANVTPTFTQLGPYCQGDTPGTLPTTSNNGVTGTWAPSTVQTAIAGNTLYTFIKANGQCATNTNMTITVNAKVNPTFTQLGPYCVGDTPGTLPTTSNNGVAGTWNPSTVSTTASGSTIYTFTPDAGVCANTATMTVVVNDPVTPTFTQLGPYCQGATPGTLPTTSNNGVAGTWNAAISTATPGINQYTFTPNAGLCATTATMNIVVNAPTVPTFAQLGPYCQGDTPGTLPTTSNNGVTGTWDAAISTSTPGSTDYTFTPDAGQCATTYVMTVVVNAKVTPTFAQMGPYCEGDKAPGTQLPTTSQNGITGTWVPSFVNTAIVGTNTYTFTPDAGQCAFGTTMTVTVNAKVTPTFAQLGPYCLNDTPGTLPGASINGVTGTWNPATVSTSALGSTVYTFTPDAGVCAFGTTMTIVVTDPVIPTFAQLGPYCEGTTPGTLPLISSNGVAGTWNPAAISTSTLGSTVYTFTPNAGICATTATMTVVVNANVTPTFAQLGPYCQGATPDPLPTTSINGITGTWNAPISTTTPGTVVYTFTPTAGLCATTATMSVTVNPLPAAAGVITGPNSVLVNTSHPYFITAIANANTYEWTYTGTGVTINGTGLNVILDFAGNATGGQLKVRGQNNCGFGVESSLGIGIGTTPPTVYAVTGGGNYCEGSAGLPVGVSNSEIGVTYELYKNTVATGITVLGTGNPITFGNQLFGTYTVRGTNGGGSAFMTGSAVIIEDAKVTPTFTQLGPYCQGATPGLLSASSLNGITGTWNPALVSTATPGSTDYTFTPDAGQCANIATMTVVVNANVTPTFAQLGPYCQGATPATLPTTSQNGITGTWNAPISTATPGSTIYTFTPTAGLCATTATMTVVVDANVTPTFAQLGPYCQGATPATLPTTSQNGITGTWNAPISTATPGINVYTFTPTAGQCATTATMTIVVTANVTPTFTQLGPYCQGATPGTLPATSNNGISGTWNPSVISTATPGNAIYTFTPTAGQCATTATMTVITTAPIVPTFTQLGPYAQGATPGTLPATSNNGISGTWNPAVISTATPGNITYTFTPNAGQCATQATMVVTVNSPLIQVEFTQDIGTTIQAGWPVMAGAAIYEFSYRINGSLGSYVGTNSSIPFAKIPNLTPGTTYEYRIKGYYANTRPLPSNTIMTGLFTTTTVPYTESQDIGTTIQIDWTDWSWASSYNFQYKLAGSTTWIPAVAYMPTVKLSNLAPNSTYDCRVLVYKGGALWGTTKAGQFFTGSVAFNQAAKTLTSATVECTSFPWATLYGFSYKPQSSSTWINKIAFASNSFSFTGLTANTVYDVKVYIYDVNGLWGASQQGTFNTITGPVKSINTDNNISVYPNPFVDQVNMALFTETETKVIWDVYDVTGNVVLSGSQSLTGGYSTLNIDAASLSKGVYMLRTVMNDQMMSFRIMKQ